MYQGETLGMVLERWKKLLCDFYRARKDRFDLSKVPDVFDCAKHDVLHNADLGIPAVGLTSCRTACTYPWLITHDLPSLAQLRPLYDVAKSLADVVIPQEYGITAEDKQAIGVSIACDLVRKLRADLFIAADLAHSASALAGGVPPSPSAAALIMRRIPSPQIWTAWPPKWCTAWTRARPSSWPSSPRAATSARGSTTPQSPTSTPCSTSCGTTATKRHAQDATCTSLTPL